MYQIQFYVRGVVQPDVMTYTNKSDARDCFETMRQAKLEKTYVNVIDGYGKNLFVDGADLNHILFLDSVQSLRCNGALAILQQDIQAQVNREFAARPPALQVAK